MNINVKTYLAPGKRKIFANKMLTGFLLGRKHNAVSRRVYNTHLSDGNDCLPVTYFINSI